MESDVENLLVSEVTEGGTQHDEEKSSFLVCMRGRAGYIHEYVKDLGISDDEAVYPSFYLRQLVTRTKSSKISQSIASLRPYPHRRDLHS